MTETPDPVTGGWIRATRHALGLSSEQLATILDVREQTLRGRWEFGTDPIPQGVGQDMMRLIRFTDNAVDTLRRSAARIADPSICVYQRYDQLPEHHIAWRFGLDWWDRVAVSVPRGAPGVVVGFPWEIAAAFEYSQDDPRDIHDDPHVIGLYVADRDADPLLTGAHVA